MLATVVMAAMALMGLTGDPLEDVPTLVGPSVVRIACMDRDGEEKGNGSGFVVSADGVVVTNEHVVDGCGADAVAVFADGRRVPVLGTYAIDKEHDIALLQIEARDLTPLLLADDVDLVVGRRAFLLGSSSGFDQSLGVGVVAAVRPGYPEEMLRRMKKAGEDVKLGPLLQHTATSTPGSSGSPVVNDAGRVMGVHHSSVGGSLLFAAHVSVLRELLRTTDFKAPLKPLGPDVKKNLLISAAVFGTIALVAVIVTTLQRRRIRRQHAARRARHVAAGH